MGLDVYRLTEWRTTRLDVQQPYLPPTTQTWEHRYRIVKVAFPDHCGGQVSYSGCLLENVNSLAANQETFGYQVNYNHTYAAARCVR